MFRMRPAKERSSGCPSARAICAIPQAMRRFCARNVSILRSLRSRVKGSLSRDAETCTSLVVCQDRPHKIHNISAAGRPGCGRVWSRPTRSPREQACGGCVWGATARRRDIACVARVLGARWLGARERRVLDCDGMGLRCVVLDACRGLVRRWPLERCGRRMVGGVPHIACVLSEDGLDLPDAGPGVAARLTQA